jgi:hypothetical protein
MTCTGRQRHRLGLASLLALLALAGVAPQGTRAESSEIAVNLTPPSISGDPRPDQTLTASPGTWKNEPTKFEYRWELCGPSGECQIVAGSDQSIYGVRPGDVGEDIRVGVFGENQYGGMGYVLSAPVRIKPAWEWVIGPPRVEMESWTVSLRSPSSVAGRTVAITVNSGYCVGEPQPVVDHVAVVERPRTAQRPYKSAVITAFVRFPAPHEIVGTWDPREGVIPGCADVGLSLPYRVKLRRPAGRLFLFDGSRSPPRRVTRPHSPIPPAARVPHREARPAS